MKISNNFKKELKKILIDQEIEAISIVDEKKFEQNIKNFEQVFHKNKIKYAIHSVLKVNHSNRLLKTALKNNCRADVSSIGELEQAIKCGFTGQNITTNGPKNKKFLQKSIDIGATIVVDSVEELEKICEIGKNLNKKIPILIRLWAFNASRDTRFWIAKFLWKIAEEIINKSKDYIDVLGYHFHIDVPDVNTRIDIFWESLEFYKKLLSCGFTPKIINIGGSYWTYYQNDVINNTQITKTKNNMYMNHEYSWKNFLEQFLTKDIKWKPRIIDFIRENDLQLWIEPGRALFSENVGCVATTVLWTRESSLIVNTNSFGLGMREEELPTNPILIDDIYNSNKKFSYYFLWNLCLESDIIYSRTIDFGRSVTEDDIIIFPNMGAYHQDFYETESIAHPKKQRFYIDENDILHPDI